MKTKSIAIVAGVAGVLIMSGCSSVKVHTDYDHAAAFGQYRTYALEPPKDAPRLSPTAEAALRDSVRADMAKRGIREVGLNENPELAVVPHINQQQKYSVQQYTAWGYGPGVWPYGGGYYYGAWSGSPYTYSTIDSYTEGTLILDFVDTANRKLVFRGTGVATITGDTEKNADKIRTAVGKIVAKIPETSATAVGGSD